MRNLMIPNRFAREIDDMFNTFLTFPRLSTNEVCDFYPRVDIRETNDTVRLVFEIPGIEKKDVKVTVKDNILTVAGERKTVTEEKDSDLKYVRNEILTGSFSRSFTLPETVDAEKVTAEYRNGLMEITLAKKEAVKPKEIEVRVS